MSQPPKPIQTYVWELTEDGKLAIVQHGQSYHVLVASDTFLSLSQAVQRVQELERQFEQAAQQSGAQG